MNKAITRKFYGFSLSSGMKMPFWIWTDLAKMLPNDTTIVGFQYDDRRHSHNLVLHSEQFPLMEDHEELKTLQCEVKVEGDTQSMRLFIWSRSTAQQEFINFNTTPEGRYDGLYKALKSLEAEAKTAGQEIRSGFKLLLSQDIPQGEIHFVQPNQSTKIINLQSKEEIEIYESSQVNRRVRP